MELTRQADGVSLRANPLEAQVLSRVLRSVLKYYKPKPSELDEKSARAWYSRQSQSHMTAEEIADWTAALHSFKTERIGHLQRWLAELGKEGVPVVELRMDNAEASALIGVLNDRRLFLAAQHDLGQDEMDLHSAEELKQLPAARQSALYEIHFLAVIIEELIHCALPEASRWSEDSGSETNFPTPP